MSSSMDHVKLLSIQRFIAQRARYTHLLLVICLGLLLSSCSNPPPAPQPLPELHLAHVTRFPWLNSVVRTERLGGVATYQSTQDGAPARLMAFAYGDVYDVGLDGSDLHVISGIAGLCTLSLSISQDNQWAACAAENGIPVFNLSDTVYTISTQVLADSATDGRYDSPTWSPDGQAFAAIKLLPNSSLGNIVFYRVTPAHDHAQLVGQLTIANVGVYRVSWSPDGNWLLVILGDTARYYVLSLGRIFAQLPAADAPPGNWVIPRQQLVPISDWTGDVFTWENHGAVLTVAHNGDIWRYDVNTGQQTRLAKLGISMCSLAWTPDGTQLIFEYCSPSTGNPDYPSPPSQLYLYTPPS